MEQERLERDDSQLKSQIDQKNKEMKELKREMNIITDSLKNLQMDNNKISEERTAIDTITASSISRKKTLQMNLNRHNKEINDATFERKKLLHTIQSIEGNVKEIQNQISGMTKQVEEKKRESEQLEIQQKHLMDEQQIFVGQLVKKGLDDKAMEVKFNQLQIEIGQHKS